MCRKNELFGSIIMAFGAGILVSLLFASDFVLALIGVGFLICGLCCCKKQ